MNISRHVYTLLDLKPLRLNLSLTALLSMLDMVTENHIFLGAHALDRPSLFFLFLWESLDYQTLFDSLLSLACLVLHFQPALVGGDLVSLDLL